MVQHCAFCDGMYLVSQCHRVSSKGTSSSKKAHQPNPQGHGPIWQYQVDIYSALKCLQSYGRCYSKSYVYRNFGNLNTMATATWDQLFFLLLS